MQAVDKVRRSRTCKEAITCVLVSVGGCVIVDALSSAERMELAYLSSFIIMALAYMWMIVLLTWRQRALENGGAEKEEVRRHIQSPQEATQHRVSDRYGAATRGGIDTSVPPAYAALGTTGRSVMERLAGPCSWSYQRFKRVLIASAVLDEDIPARCRPDTVDLGEVARHAQDLTARSARDGSERCRVYLVDVERHTLLQGKTTRGDRASVQPDWSAQTGREAVQKRSFCIHTHPVGLQSPVQGLSDHDYEGFLCDREQRATIMVSGGSIMMILQTSATPRVSSPEVIKRRLDLIKQDARTQARGHLREDWVVEFNRGVCVQFGLCLYLGGEDGQMRRIRVV
jgi:hypothetical protein